MAPRAGSGGAGWRGADEGSTGAGRFACGSPLAGDPALGPEGSLFLATADGYLHVLDAALRHRFSHVLAAPASGAPVVDADGVAYVATRSGVVLAVAGDGVARWTYRLPEELRGDLALTSDALWAPARDALYELSKSGGLRSRWTLPARTSTDVVVAGEAVLVGGDGGWLLAWGEHPRREQLGGAFRQPPIASPDGAIGVVLDDDLVVLDRDQRELWTRRGARLAASAPDGWATFDAEWRLVEWTRRGERREASAPLGAASAPPVALGAGVWLVALASGEALWLSRGAVTRRQRVADGPLRRPLVDRARARVLFASGEGVVTALPL